MNCRREQFGERGGDGLERRALADEPDVGLHREAHRRQRSLHRHHIGPVEAEAVGQLEPPLDAARIAVEAVVIEDPPHPDASQLPILQPTEERRVLARDRRLVAVAVQGPGLHLTAAEPASVEQRVERVLVVIALRADSPQPQFQIVARASCSQHDLQAVLGDLPPGRLRLPPLRRIPQ